MDDLIGQGKNFELETRIAVMEREMTHFSTIVGKFDSTIDKLTSVTNTIDKMLPIITLQITDAEKDNVTINKKYEELVVRVNALEKWKWIVMGIAAGIALLFSKLNIPWTFLTS